MIFLMLGMGLVFMGIGVLVAAMKKSNIRTTYAHVRQDEGQAAGLGEETRYFSRFHLFLGLSLAVAGTIIHRLWGETSSLLFLIFYPLAAYTWYFGKSAFTKKGGISRGGMAGLLVLISAGLIVLVILRSGFKENQVLYEPGFLKITGAYGEQIHASDIEYIRVTDTLPDIRLKTNGFAMGRIRKGFFRTRDGETVKLLIDAPKGPYLHLHRMSGDNLYIALRSKPAEMLLQDVQQQYPSVEIK